MFHFFRKIFLLTWLFILAEAFTAQSLAKAKR